MDILSVQVVGRIAMLNFKGLTKLQDKVVQLAPLRAQRAGQAPVPDKPLTASKAKKPPAAAAAVHQFLDAMTEAGAGNEFEWKRIARSYNQMRAERGWPALSDKVLSELLVAFGCKKRRIRVAGGSRPTFFELPLSFEEAFAMAS
jgi:hypothetical protein